MSDVKRKIKRIKQSRLTDNEILIISLLRSIKVSSITDECIYWEFDNEYMFKYTFKDAKLGVSSKLKKYYSNDFSNIDDLKNFIQKYVEEYLEIKKISVVKFFIFDSIEKK